MMKINKRNFESGNTLIRNIINKLKKKKIKDDLKRKKKCSKERISSNEKQKMNSSLKTLIYY